MPTLEELMNELQVLGGVRGKPRASANPVVHPRLRAMMEGDGGMASRENLKGKIEVLAKRMEGVTDFLGDDNMKAAKIALQKIVQDAQSILDDMSEPAEKGDEKAKAKAKEKEDLDKEQQLAKGGKEKPGGAPDRAIGKEQQSPKGTPAQSMQPQQQPAGEERVYAGGMLIENMSDPFGMGEAFKQFIMDRSGVGKKN